MSENNDFSRPVRVGIGGPVGSGKTMLTLRLCESLRDEFAMVAITNDIYTLEDAQFLAHQNALPEDRIMGVETGGCPHTAIRDDTSMNAVAIEQLLAKHPDTSFLARCSLRSVRGAKQLRRAYTGCYLRIPRSVMTLRYRSTLRSLR